MSNEQGATLLFALWVPGASHDTDPDIVADQLRDILNEERARNGGPFGPVEVSIPLPQWLTSEVLENLRALRAWLTQENPDEQ